MEFSRAMKISISISEDDLARIEAIRMLERRSRSNAIISLLNYSGYEFIEVTSKYSDKIEYRVNKIENGKTTLPK